MGIASHIDEDIKVGVVDQFRWDTRIDASDLSVTVNDGNVTLEGSVPSYTARQAAENGAWSVIGVQGVDNRLTVKYTPLADIPGDETIQSNVESVLLWNPALASSAISVDVTGGWVTLSGTVDALWKKYEAEGESLDIQGVLGVTNKLAVVPTGSFTDEAIARDVVSALERNRHVTVEDISVTVTNSAVSLSGTVPSQMARAEAYQSALYTSGVTEIVDEIAVKPW
jgi:osmotically-inducible protein OsmY